MSEWVFGNLNVSSTTESAAGQDLHKTEDGIADWGLLTWRAYNASHPVRRGRPGQA